MALRIGVYSGDKYWLDADVLSSNVAFVHFLVGLAEQLDELVLFGRLEQGSDRGPDVIPPGAVTFVPLPHYGRLTDVPAVVRAWRGTRKAFGARLGSLHAVLIFGPHPLALDLVRLARRSGKPVVLGIRQDLPQYVRHRLPRHTRLWALPAAQLLERSFRRLSCRLPTVVVGEDIAGRYGGGDAALLVSGFSLVRSADVAASPATASSSDGMRRVLTVGRLDAEKNPLLLAEILALLCARGAGWQLTVAGEGPLRGRLEARAGELGVDHALDVVGYVPHGPALTALYRQSDFFLHVSLTEGLPQVLFEAAAAGLPIVATDVGGVRGALGEGGLLVPPRDAAAAASALERLWSDGALRERVAEAALEWALRQTLEAQAEQLVRFVQASTGQGSP